MVVCAVRYEPVSTPNSLIRAVLQGIFRKIRGFAQQRFSVAQLFQRLGWKFPGEASREFFRASREAAGNTFAKTGNLLWRDFIAGKVHRINNENARTVLLIERRLRALLTESLQSPLILKGYVSADAA